MSNSTCLDDFSASRAPATGRAVVAFAGEPFAQRVAHHQSHRPRSGSCPSSLLRSWFSHAGYHSVSATRVRRNARRHAHRRLDQKFGSFARRGADRDLSRVLLHDAVRHGQSQAGAVLVLLGGEEGLEDMRAERPAGMPPPVSFTRTALCSAALECGGDHSLPPLSHGFPALTIRTRTTCWIWLASHCTGGRSAASDSTVSCDVLHFELVLDQQHRAVTRC